MFRIFLKHFFVCRDIKEIISEVKKYDLNDSGWHQIRHTVFRPCSGHSPFHDTMHQERLLLLRHQKWTVHVSQKQFLMDQISSSLDNVKGGLMAVNARVSFSYSHLKQCIFQELDNNNLIRLCLFVNTDVILKQKAWVYNMCSIQFVTSNRLKISVCIKNSIWQRGQPWGTAVPEEKNEIYLLSKCSFQVLEYETLIIKLFLVDKLKITWG